jgi:hypothetical protein
MVGRNRLGELSEELERRWFITAQSVMNQRPARQAISFVYPADLTMTGSADAAADRHPVHHHAAGHAGHHHGGHAVAA